MYNEYFPLGDFELMGKLAQHFSLKKFDASFRKGNPLIIFNQKLYQKMHSVLDPVSHGRLGLLGHISPPAYSTLP